MRTRLFPAGSPGTCVPLLVSEVIGAEFVHGFSTRGGGVSPPPFDTLNLGRRWGDADENVAENRRRLRAAVGLPLTFARQVHGAAVRRVHAGETPAVVAAAEADALYTTDAGLAVGVYVADCVPLLLADPRTAACGAVHAGWRGTVAGVTAEAVAAIVRAGARPDELRAALGPCIRACCFEVGPEVAAAFASAFPGAPVVQERPGAKPHVDLPLANVLLLQRAGLRAQSIDDAGACTMCDPDGRFYSYRRWGTATGQQVGFIGRAAVTGP